ncbi:4-carboxymuconolactone decarboxylase [Fusarium globosum]|uniref:4-carboxymuconolactone decarboxylase n=1 Tax=Fusarium globosum TaxID=78864 RepID=A0A8H5UI95_9HYPO|nr:4-carboxymuconolactone decarboxylase [Fusarium globosum]
MPDLHRLHDELFKTGLRNRREVVGNAYVDAALSNGSSEFAYPGQQLVTEWCWGNVWSRPGLDRKQRSLLSKILARGTLSKPSTVANLNLIPLDIGMLIAIKSWPELGVHVRGALNNGLTEVEVREAILHATIYCGVPAGLEAMKVAERTINDMIAKGEHKRELAETSPLVGKSASISDGV